MGLFSNFLAKIKSFLYNNVFLKTGKNSINEQRIYGSIYSFMSESMDDKRAAETTDIVMDGINDKIKVINRMLTKSELDVSELSVIFHTLKSYLLYGDFDYESDICQDIEIALRENEEVPTIKCMFDELVKRLKQ